jgi:hypothetical protein
MNGGDVTISTKKKGIHADSALYLRGSTINVVTSLEAIEAYEIFAEGGVTSVFATNDGWNGGGGVGVQWLSVLAVGSHAHWLSW